MNTPSVLDVEQSADVDVLEEMRLRTWARKNYLPKEDRNSAWHPVILDEMDRKDEESL